MAISNKVIEFRKVSHTKRLLVLGTIVLLLIMSASFAVAWAVAPRGQAGAESLRIVYDDLDRWTNALGQEEIFAVPGNVYTMRFAPDSVRLAGEQRRLAIEYDNNNITMLDKSFDPRSGETEVSFRVAAVITDNNQTITARANTGNRRDELSFDFVLRNANSHSIEFRSSEIIEIAYDEVLAIGSGIPSDALPVTTRHTTWFYQRGKSLGAGMYARFNPAISGITAHVARLGANGNFVDSVAIPRMGREAEEFSIGSGLPVIVYYNNEQVTVRYNNITNNIQEAMTVVVILTANTVHSSQDAFMHGPVVAHLIVELRASHQIRSGVDNLFLFDHNVRAANPSYPSTYGLTFGEYLDQDEVFNPRTGTFPRIMIRVPDASHPSGFAVGADGRFEFRLNPAFGCFVMGANNPLYRYYGFSNFDINDYVVSFPYMTREELRGRFGIRNAGNPNLFSVINRGNGIYTIQGNGSLITAAGENSLELSFEDVNGNEIVRLFDFGVRFRVVRIRLINAPNEVTIGGTFAPMRVAFDLATDNWTPVAIHSTNNVHFDTTVALNAQGGDTIESDAEYLGGGLFRPAIMGTLSGAAFADIGVRYVTTSDSQGRSSITIAHQGTNSTVQTQQLTARAQAAGIMFSGDNVDTREISFGAITVGQELDLTTLVRRVVVDPVSGEFVEEGTAPISNDYRFSFRFYRVNSAGQASLSTDAALTQEGLLRFVSVNNSNLRHYKVTITITRADGTANGIGQDYMTLTVLFPNALDHATALSFAATDRNATVRTYTTEIVYVANYSGQITATHITEVSIPNSFMFSQSHDFAPNLPGVAAGRMHLGAVRPGLSSNQTGGVRGQTLFAGRITSGVYPMPNHEWTFAHNGRDVLRLRQTGTNPNNPTFNITILDGAHVEGLNSFSLFLARDNATFGNVSGNQALILEMRYDIRRGVDGVRVYSGNAVPNDNATLGTVGLITNHNLGNIAHNAGLGRVLVPYRRVGSMRLAHLAGWDALTIDSTPNGLFSHNGGGHFHVGTVSGSTDAQLIIRNTDTGISMVTLSARVFSSQTVNFWYTVDGSLRRFGNPITVSPGGTVANNTAAITSHLNSLGHDFLGWFANPNLTGNQFSFGTVIDGDLNLYASTRRNRFTVNYKIQVEGIWVVHTSWQVPLGATPSRPAIVGMTGNPTIMVGGHLPIAWYTNNAFIGQPANGIFNQNITADIDLFARFADVFSVNFYFEVQGHRVLAHSERVVDGAFVQGPNGWGWTSIDVNVDGYAFHGQWQELDGTPFVGASIRRDKNLFAVLFPTGNGNLPPQGHSVVMMIMHEGRGVFTLMETGIQDGWAFNYAPFASQTGFHAPVLHHNRIALERDWSMSDPIDINNVWQSGIVVYRVVYRSVTLNRRTSAAGAWQQTGINVLHGHSLPIMRLNPYNTSAFNGSNWWRTSGGSTGNQYRFDRTISNTVFNVNTPITHDGHQLWLRN